MLQVQQRMCDTCVYRQGSPLNPRELEARVRDDYGGFTAYRVCHSAREACCAGFWARHKDKFQLGQIAQRLGLVQFVQENVPTRTGTSVKRLWALQARRRR